MIIDDCIVVDGEFWESLAIGVRGLMLKLLVEVHVDLFGEGRRIAVGFLRVKDTLVILQTVVQMKLLFSGDRTGRWSSLGLQRLLVTGRFQRMTSALLQRTRAEKRLSTRVVLVKGGLVLRWGRRMWRRRRLVEVTPIERVFIDDWRSCCVVTIPVEEDFLVFLGTFLGLCDELELFCPERIRFGVALFGLEGLLLTS